MESRANWIKDWRKESLQLFETIKEPSFKDELYRHAPLSSLRLLWKEGREEKPLKSLENKEEKRSILAGKEAVLFLCSSVGQDTAHPSSLPKGVYFSSMETAIEKAEKLLQPYWKGPSLWAKDKFVQQSYGNFQGGFFLHVGENINVTKTLRVSSKEKDCFHRNIVVLEKGASLNLIEEYFPEEGEYHSGVTEFYVKEGAHLINVYLQEFSRSTNYSSRKYIELEKEASMEYVDLAWGGAKGQERLEVDLLGEKAKIKASVACRLDLNQHFAFVGNIRHHAPHTSSELHSHSVLADESKATLNATVQVKPHALHVESEQRNRGLLLSKKANVYSMPKLLIATDEVNCAHGSSISHIEEDALYYMESRGIARKDAIKMLVNALIEPILRKIPLGDRREWVSSRLDKKSWGELV